MIFYTIVLFVVFKETLEKIEKWTRKKDQQIYWKRGDIILR